MAIVNDDTENWIKFNIFPKEYNNLGQGSIPVRNWIDEYSRMNRIEKYWL